MSTACYRTTVINTSGKERSFGFLGKHGRRLGVGEQYSEPGDLLAKLQGHKRKFDAYLRALSASKIAVIQTPPAQAWDAALGRTQVLGVNNGAVTVGDPCSGAYDTAITGAWTAIPDGSAAVATATLTFVNPVTGFTAADLRLTRAGNPVTPLTGVAVASGDGGKTWTVTGLAAHTTTNGAYVLRVESDASGITDQFGNVLAADISEGWTKS